MVVQCPLALVRRREFDRREGRLVYTFAGLVAALPSLAYTLSSTALFPNYQTAWNAEQVWPALLLAFPFWGVVVSYKGVRTKFVVRATPARVWFLGLPVLLYAVALGVIGVLYAFLVPEASRAVA